VIVLSVWFNFLYHFTVANTAFTSFGITCLFDRTPLGTPWSLATEAVELISLELELPLGVLQPGECFEVVTEYQDRLFATGNGP